MKNKKSWSAKRSRGISIPVGKNLLFIYCGECTEPHYFGKVLKNISNNFFTASHGQTRLEIDDVIDCVDPLHMAKDVKRIISSAGKTFDEVWVVFDKDSFLKDNFDNAIHCIEDMNNERSKTRYFALWSNQCVELWFILHFEFYQSASMRDDYYPKLNKYLDGKYQKSDKDIHDKIQQKGGLLKQAINNAHKLLEMHKNESFSNKWPATNIVQLFDEYNDYLKG